MTVHEPTRKITISLPAALVSFADDWAKELNTSRSQVIGMALAAVKTREHEQLAAEGYRFYAQEASEFASIARRAIAEAWGDDRPEQQAACARRVVLSDWNRSAG